MARPLTAEQFAALEAWVIATALYLTELNKDIVDRDTVAKASYLQRKKEALASLVGEAEAPELRWPIQSADAALKAQIEAVRQGVADLEARLDASDRDLAQRIRDVVGDATRRRIAL